MDYKAIRRVLWITMLLNIVATVAKLAAGIYTRSLALLADGVDSVFDAATNVVGLLGIRIASRPADEEHPYGHGKAEAITALLISSLLFLAAWELGKGAVERLLDPQLINAEGDLWGVAAALVSIVLHLVTAWYELAEGRRLHSGVLVADALHTRADIWVSVSVIVGLIAVRLGYPMADPLVALVISVVIAKAGVDVIRETSPALMDQARLSSTEVAEVAESVPGVRSVHQVRSRGQESAVYADLHVRVDPDTTTERAHAIAHEVQHRLREQRPGIADVTVHVEPSGTAPAQESPEALVTLIRRIAAGIDLDVHDIWAHTMAGRTHLELHLEADGALSLSEAHSQATQLERRIREQLRDVEEITTHLEPRGSFLPDHDHAQANNELGDEICSEINEIVGGDTCHKMRAYRRGDLWDVSFHCRLPGDIPLAQAHATCGSLEAKLRARVDGLQRIVIHVEPQQTNPTEEAQCQNP